MPTISFDAARRSADVVGWNERVEIGAAAGCERLIDDEGETVMSGAVNSARDGMECTEI